MTTGRNHNLITLGASAALYLLAPYPHTERIALGAGCLAGILITPDLDVDGLVASHGVMRSSLGALPGFLWRLLWLPYSYLIPHRHWLSHAPIIGTAGRLAYMAGLAWLVMRLLSIPIPPLPYWSIYAVAGLAVSDALHWLADR